MRKFQLLVFLFFVANFATAQDMVYKAKNPAFGGDTFNYQWLQSSAQAQNSLEDPSKTTTSSTSSSSLNSFSETLNRQLLYSLSQQIVKDQFGEGSLQPGQYTFGSFSVDISPSIDGLLVNIFDGATGQSTQVLVPFF